MFLFSLAGHHDAKRIGRSSPLRRFIRFARAMAGAVPSDFLILAEGAEVRRRVETVAAANERAATLPPSSNLNPNSQILRFSDSQILPLIPPLHRDLFFLQMQPERLPTENGDLVDLAADINASAACRRSGALREHCHFARSVIDLVELERHERNSPRRRDGAVDVDRAILIPARIQLELGDARTSERSAGTVRVASARTIRVRRAFSVLRASCVVLLRT